MATQEVSQLIERYGQPIYPAPRYSIPHCLILLGIGRKPFYERVRDGRYRITKDGARSYMTHAQLLEAAEGDAEREQAA